jgi:phosphoglycerate dehydrogenase-like enzyme
MKLLFCGNGWLSIVDRIQERLPDATIELWDRSVPLPDAVGEVDVLLPSNGRIDAAVIEAAPKLVLIQQPAAGVERIDLEAARARGIPVCNAPGANHVSVAEAALFLMLALARRVPELTRSFTHRRIGEPVGVELCGKTLGIVGMGRSGKALAERARGLGMHVRGVSSTSTRAELRALLAESDAISLHVPLTERTRHIIDAEALAIMKPGAFLINCARGGVVERAALEQALERGHLGGVGIDTPFDEPWDPDEPLYARDNVIVLPHVAGSTREAFARIADIVADNVTRVRRGDELRFRVA